MANEITYPSVMVVHPPSDLGKRPYAIPIRDANDLIRHAKFMRDFRYEKKTASPVSTVTVSGVFGRMHFEKDERIHSDELPSIESMAAHALGTMTQRCDFLTVLDALSLANRLTVDTASTDDRDIGKQIMASIREIREWMRPLVLLKFDEKFGSSYSLINDFDSLIGAAMMYSDFTYNVMNYHDARALHRLHRNEPASLVEAVGNQFDEPVIRFNAGNSIEYASIYNFLCPYGVAISALEAAAGISNHSRIFYFYERDEMKRFIEGLSDLDGDQAKEFIGTISPLYALHG